MGFANRGVAVVDGVGGIEGDVDLCTHYQSLQYGDSRLSYTYRWRCKSSARVDDETRRRRDGPVDSGRDWCTGITDRTRG